MTPPEIGSTGSTNASFEADNRPVNETNTVPAKQSARSQQIAQIQAQIKNGQFTVDLGRLATAIVASGQLNE